MIINLLKRTFIVYFIFLSLSTHPAVGASLCASEALARQPPTQIVSDADLARALVQHGTAAFKLLDQSLANAALEPIETLDLAAWALGAGHTVSPPGADAVHQTLTDASWIEAVGLIRLVSKTAGGEREYLRRRLEAALVARLGDNALKPSTRIERIAAALVALRNLPEASIGRSLEHAWSSAVREGASALDARLATVDQALRRMLMVGHPFAPKAARQAWNAEGAPTDLIRLAAAPSHSLFTRFLKAEAPVDRAIAARIAYGKGYGRRARLLTKAAIAASSDRDRLGLHERISVLIALGPALTNQRAETEGRRILQSAAGLTEATTRVEVLDHLLFAAIENTALAGLGATAADHLVAALADESTRQLLRPSSTWAISRVAATPWAAKAFRGIAKMEVSAPAVALYRLGLALEIGETEWARGELARLCADSATSPVISAGRLIERALNGEPVLPPVEYWNDLALFTDLQR